jgi:hypothetical protein
MLPNALVTLTALAPPLPGLSGGTGAMAAAFAVPVAGAIYFLLTWGKRSSGECSWRDDDQIGLKVIVGALIMVGTVLFAAGLQGLLHLLMTFKNFVPTIKAVLPDLLVGVVVVGGSIMFAVPKTNHAQQPKALRLTAGAIALVGAVATVINLDELLKTIFQWPSWSDVAGALTSLVTSVVVFGGSGYLYAKMVGVEMPDIPLPSEAQAQPAQQQYQQQPPQQQYQQQPPQQGGYQQPGQPGPGGGYPPQQGGGGYPPSGGPYGQ